MQLSNFYKQTTYILATNRFTKARIRSVFSSSQLGEATERWSPSFHRCVSLRLWLSEAWSRPHLARAFAHQIMNRAGVGRLMPYNACQAGRPGNKQDRQIFHSQGTEVGSETGEGEVQTTALEGRERGKDRPSRPAVFQSSSE